MQVQFCKQKHYFKSWWFQLVYLAVSELFCTSPTWVGWVEMGHNRTTESSRNLAALSVIYSTHPIAITVELKSTTVNCPTISTCSKYSGSLYTTVKIWWVHLCSFHSSGFSCNSRLTMSTTEWDIRLWALWAVGLQNYWAVSLHIVWAVPLPFAAILHCSHLWL